jgi:hypothetical protein
MHTVLFVVDTGLAMTALAHDERPKKDLAILTVGVLGLLALRHGDDFAWSAVIPTRPPSRDRPQRGRAGAHPAHDRPRGRRRRRPSDRDAVLSYVARTICAR